MDTLRERKKQRTREHLSRVAMKLFADRGLHAVTIEEICERAEVSPRTFFRYFPSKEDVVFTNDAARRAIVRDALARQLPDETLSAAARRAIRALIAHDLQEDRDTARLRARLLANEPALARHLTALTADWTRRTQRCRHTTTRRRPPSPRGRPPRARRPDRRTQRRR